MMGIRQRWRRTAPILIILTSSLVPVEAAVARVAPAPGFPASGLQGVPDSIAAVDRIFSRWATAESPGCAVGVSRGGRTLVARAYGMADLEHGVPNGPRTIFEAGSVSKQFTAAAIFLLAQAGSLSLDDDVRRYLPELPDYGEPITIRHLIQHTSGLRDWGVVASVSGWPRTRRAHDNSHALDIIVRQRSLNYSPGAEYSYTNSGYNMMAIIVERVSGESLAEFTRKQIFEPLGMRHTSWRDDFTRIVPGRATAYRAERDGYSTLMPFENVYGNGGLLTTVEDLLIWNENLSSGRVGGKALIEELHRQGRLRDGREISYAGGLMIGRYQGFDEVSHSGSTAGYQAFLTRFPSEELSVAVLCNVTGTNPGRLARQTAELFLPGPAAVSSGAAGAATSPSPRGIDLPQSVLQGLSGVYRHSRTGNPVHLTLTEAELRLDRTTALVPISDTIFQAGSGGARLAVERGRDGRPLRLRHELADGDVVVYEAVGEAARTSAELSAYQGEYHSDEAEATYKVVLNGERLELWRRPGVTIPLTPVYADAFTAANGWLVRFRRAADGRVEAMSFGMGRVREISFDRVGG